MSDAAWARQQHEAQQEVDENARVMVGKVDLDVAMRSAEFAVASRPEGLAPAAEEAIGVVAVDAPFLGPATRRRPWPEAPAAQDLLFDYPVHPGVSGNVMVATQTLQVPREVPKSSLVSRTTTLRRRVCA